MRIAIVDDDEGFVEKVERQIRNFFREMQEQLYIWKTNEAGCGTVLQALKEQNHFDIYLFDVEMPEKQENGLELGEKVHELDPKGKIIFLTSHSEYVLRGFQVGAYYYILKDSPWQAELFKIIGCILKEQAEDREEIVIFTDGDFQCGVLVNDILYLTKDKKYTIYHCLDRSGGAVQGWCKSQEYRERAPLEAAHARLPEKRFILISKGIVVNMKHVIRTEKLEVVMRDGVRFPISKINKTQVCDRMAAYWGEEP